MKTLSIYVLLVLGVSAAATASASGVPVVDAARISQSMQQQLETIAKWQAQYDQMKNQLDQMKRQYESITGTRDMGEIFNDPQLRDYLPNDWQSVYDGVRDGGYSGLSGTGRSVYDANKIYDACKHAVASDARTACEARAVKGAQDKGFALDAYKKAKNRLNQIDQLMRSINGTQDPKAIAELQGRIAAEQAAIQNEHTKLQMYAMVAAAEDRLQEQRQREINARGNARRGYVTPRPVDFGN